MKEKIKLISKNDKRLFEKIKKEIIDKEEQEQISFQNEYWETFGYNSVKNTILELRRLFKFDDEIIYELFKLYDKYLALKPSMAEKIIVFCKIFNIKSIEDLRKNKQFFGDSLIIF